MRDIFIVITIIVIVFAGNFLMKSFYNSSSKDILSDLGKMVEGFETTDSEYKKEMVENLKVKWEHYQNYWLFFQYHETINNMQDVLLEFTESYLLDNKDDFFISYEKFKRNIEDLSNRLDISLVNIF